MKWQLVTYKTVRQIDPSIMRRKIEFRLLIQINVRHLSRFIKKMLLGALTRKPGLSRKGPSRFMLGKGGPAARRRGFFFGSHADGR